MDLQREHGQNDDNDIGGGDPPPQPQGGGGDNEGGRRALLDTAAIGVATMNKNNEGMWTKPLSSLDLLVIEVVPSSN